MWRDVRDLCRVAIWVTATFTLVTAQLLQYLWTRLWSVALIQDAGGRLRIPAISWEVVRQFATVRNGLQVLRSAPMLLRRAPELLRRLLIRL